MKYEWFLTARSSCARESCRLVAAGDATIAFQGVQSVVDASSLKRWKMLFAMICCAQIVGFNFPNAICVTGHIVGSMPIWEVTLHAPLDLFVTFASTRTRNVTLKNF